MCQLTCSYNMPCKYDVLYVVVLAMWSSDLISFSSRKRRGGSGLIQVMVLRMCWNGNANGVKETGPAALLVTDTGWKEMSSLSPSLGSGLWWAVPPLHCPVLATERWSPSDYRLFQQLMRLGGPRSVSSQPHPEKKNSAWHLSLFIPLSDEQRGG